MRSPAEQIGVAAEALSRYKLRTALSVLGVVLGIAAVIAMMSVSDGARREALAQVEALGLDNLVARWQRSTAPGVSAGPMTSGDAEQFVEIGGVRYSHIVSPTTGLGLTNRIQASVIAPNATTTDALATALCVMGVDRSLALVKKMPKTGVLILTKEGEKNRSFVAGTFNSSLEMTTPGVH